MPEITVPSISEIKTAAREAFAEVLNEELPKIVRRAKRKPYLTTKDVKEKFGFSYRKQQHMRDEQDLGYIQDGRKILYPIEAFEKWADEHSVNLNPLDN